ncbi:hypothetical protein DL93DRAFT_2086598 [Clavulina sp. PMI_390]|nr:hypothetical protein DL93DRAFT_2086598 [Clavulina sp. PMI_390]
MALKVYSETKEPYLQLAAPFEHIRITAPRLSDVPLMAKMLNSHSVWPFLSAPTYPYSEEAVRETISARQLPSCEKAWSEIRDKVIAGDKDYVARSMPVMSVREVLEDGSEVYRGDAWVNRSWYHEVEDLDERRKAEEENLAKEAGDPTIMWALACEYTLLPSLATF